VTIEVDLSQDLGPSESSKTTMIATTEGNASVPGHESVKLGLNLYRAKK
jgi:hypothetical protein